MNMKKVSLDVWIQLVGMLSIVASLIFVGLEMRQSQRIALAAQQTARVQIFTEIVTGMTESGIAWNGPDDDYVYGNRTNQILWVFENDYLQYRLGLMDESVWQAKFRILGRVVNGCRGREIFERRRDGLDATLVSLVDSDLMSGACTQ
tara:strand:+ start:31 stop:474 length:444 start_codon:yes stop_codon:yes gene_type:complete